jgi:hypothetical protein
MMSPNITKFTFLLLITLLLPACTKVRTAVVVITATPASVTATQVSIVRTTQPAASVVASATPTHTADNTISVTSVLASPTATLVVESPQDTPRPTLKPTVTPAVTLTSTSVSAFPPDAISWNEARNHIGEEAIVCGPVVEANYAESSNGQPTFLNIGGKYVDPNRFTIVIWGRDRDKFSADPAQYYLGVTICVSGTIEEYKGIPEIVVQEPEQIEVR